MLNFNASFNLCSSTYQLPGRHCIGWLQILVEPYFPRWSDTTMHRAKKLSNKKVRSSFLWSSSWIRMIWNKKWGGISSINSVRNGIGRNYSIEVLVTLGWIERPKSVEAIIERTVETGEKNVRVSGLTGTQKDVWKNCAFLILRSKWKSIFFPGFILWFECWTRFHQNQDLFGYRGFWVTVHLAVSST